MNALRACYEINGKPKLAMTKIFLITTLSLQIILESRFSLSQMVMPLPILELTIKKKAANLFINYTITNN